MASPTIFSYTIQDQNGVKVPTQFYTNYNGATTNVDELLLAWEELGNELDAVTTGEIIGGRVLIPLAPATGWKDAPTGGTDASDVAVLNFNNPTTRYAFAELIPAILPAIISGGQIDLSNAALTSLISLILGGYTGGNYVNTAGQDLSSLRDAFQADRKHRKQLTARSKVYP